MPPTIDVLSSREVPLGGPRAMRVRRTLPQRHRSLIGAWCFVDHYGPDEVDQTGGMVVAPHPHTGLQTASWLFEGEIEHRDSAGVHSMVRPGEVNLMTAGRGIVHSERETPETQSHTRDMFGIQAWLALPKDAEEIDPGFAHHGLADLPRIEGDGKRVRLVMGEAYGRRSPVAFPHPTLYAEAVLAPGAVLPLDDFYDERAVYIASGEVDIAGDKFEAGRLLVFRPGDRISILATAQSRLMVLGGEPMDGPRHIWWNFVSSSRDRIAAAKEDWKAKRFPLVPGDEVEFIPAPA
jgi:redox-sensitive bicupin YhaK (pirin superfamily)